MKHEKHDAKPEQQLATSDEKRGFMCLVDWDVELDMGPGDGNRVYAELDALKDHHKCWEGCGVVEVALRLVRVVEPGKGAEKERTG